MPDLLKRHPASPESRFLLGVENGESSRSPRWVATVPAQLAQEPGPRVVALVTARGQPEQHRAAAGGDAPGAQDRLGWRARVQLELRGVQEQAVQLDPGKVPRLEGEVVPVAVEVEVAVPA
jgi:hypothetical protein